jgi:hypothetical protein
MLSLARGSRSRRPSVHDGTELGGERGDHPAIVAPRGRDDGDVERVSRGPDGPTAHEAMPDDAVSHSL